MGSVPGLDDDLEVYRLGRQIGKNALMRYFDDVGAGLTQDGDDVAELAGSIHDVESQLRQPAFARELAGEHAGQQSCVDIAPAQHEAKRTALEAFFVGEDRRQT